jgi:hypothetical protein
MTRADEASALGSHNDRDVCESHRCENAGERCFEQGGPRYPTSMRSRSLRPTRYHTAGSSYCFNVIDADHRASRPCPRAARLPHVIRRYMRDVSFDRCQSLSVVVTAPVSCSGCHRHDRAWLHTVTRWQCECTLLGRRTVDARAGLPPPATSARIQRRPFIHSP